jgi:prepilin-type N-terminal cleavage/methylation domain-containing protein
VTAQARAAHEQPADQGVTLVEVVVSMAVLSLVMALATGGFLQLSGTFRATTTIGEAQGQAGRVFQRLDNDVRYADDMRAEAMFPAESTAPSLLYLSTAGAVTCRALTLAGDRLLRRSWSPGETPGPAEVLAVGVVAVDGVDPMAVGGGGGAGDGDSQVPGTPKEAVITVAIRSGAGAAASHRELRETFVAPNTMYGPRGGSLDDCLG